jgi:hypothetical protein
MLSLMMPIKKTYLVNVADDFKRPEVVLLRGCPSTTIWPPARGERSSNIFIRGGFARTGTPDNPPTLPSEW